jgi:hypothetical protein
MMSQSVGEGDTAANSVFLVQGPSIAAPLSTKELPLSFHAADFGSGGTETKELSGEPSRRQPKCAGITGASTARYTRVRLPINPLRLSRDLGTVHDWQKFGIQYTVPSRLMFMPIPNVDQ